METYVSQKHRVLLRKYRARTVSVQPPWYVMLFRRNTRLFYGNTGLFYGNTRLLYGNTWLFTEIQGSFFGNTGLFYGSEGHFYRALFLR